MWPTIMAMPSRLYLALTSKVPPYSVLTGLTYYCSAEIHDRNFCITYDVVFQKKKEEKKNSALLILHIPGWLPNILAAMEPISLVTVNISYISSLHITPSYYFVTLQ